MIILVLFTWTGIVKSQPYNAPYEIPKFQAFMGECKLQAPTSSTAASQSELKNGYTSSWFYVVENDKIAFNQSGESMRTELRHETNWTLSEGDRSLHGSLKLVEQTCDQVTVLQIHDDANAGNGPNKPLLRIYKHLTRSPVDHLWAAIKTDMGGVNTKHVDLGLASTGYFDIDIDLVDGNLIVHVNDEETANEDVSFWTFPSYWKAGVYLQDDGEATVYFDQLFTGERAVLSHRKEFTSRVIVYPNPTASFFTINTGDSDLLNGAVSIYDIAGKIQRKVSITHPEIELQLLGNKGLYFVKIEKGNFQRIIRVMKK